jgi:hypothetical protein
MLSDDAGTQYSHSSSAPCSLPQIAKSSDDRAFRKALLSEGIRIPGQTAGSATYRFAVSGRGMKDPEVWTLQLATALAEESEAASKADHTDGVRLSFPTLRQRK